jgi:ribonuclease P protein component
VLAHGQRRRTARLDLAWRPNDIAHPRLGLVIPRHGESAVARNRLRRRLRDLARRRLLPGLAPLDVVIRARPPAYTARFEELGTELTQWLHTLPA